MKIKDNNGFAHFMLLAIFVLGLGIFGTYQAVSRTALVSNKTLSASAHLKSCPKPRPLLSKGSTGDCVFYVQQKLGIRPVDGIFGEDTQTAVEKYQSKKGLSSDGIIGGCTWTHLTTGRTVASCKTGKVVAKSGVQPTVTRDPTSAAKSSPRAADGKQAYCTYRDGDNMMVFKQPMTIGQCKALKGRSTTTPPKAATVKVSCSYTTKAGKTDTKLLKDTKACDTYRKSYHYGFCTRLTLSASKPETKQLCDSHKSGGAGTGTWREL